MALELVYTSAPRGLRPGTSGYATVACTRGMPAAYVEALETLSGYKPVFAAGDARAALNPVSFAHRRLTLGGKTVSVLSRVAFCGFDHTGRTNKLAHHLVLDRAEWVPGGPAWLLRQPQVLLERWDGEPRHLDAEPRLPAGDPGPAVAASWGTLTGDPGWAGALAETADGTTPRQAFLVFEPGLDVLPLIAEAIALLPPEMRWPRPEPWRPPSWPCRAPAISSIDACLICLGLS